MSENNQFRLLLVEDDEGTVYSVKRCLSLLEPSIHLSLAVEGREAVSLCKEQDYNLILMDLRLPGMDGIEATKEIRKQSKNQQSPIIAFTANSREYPREFCLGVGMNDLIDKPFDVDELLELIQNYIDTSPIA
ncbi:MAG: response regulator [Planctomycetes bacterium]|nr:response regulator [Planctomycetota bacterium]